VQRLALGLACPPVSVDSLQDMDALHTARGGWLRLRPRWPLTEERHPRAVHRWAFECAPCGQQHTLMQRTEQLLAFVGPCCNEFC
jgi:hypothetical protein